MGQIIGFQVKTSGEQHLPWGKRITIKLAILKCQPINIDGSILHLNLGLWTLHRSPLKYSIFAHQLYTHLVAPQFIRDLAFDVPNTPINFTRESIIFWNFIFDVNLRGSICEPLIMNCCLITFFKHSQLVVCWLTFDVKHAMILPDCFELDVVVVMKQLQWAVAPLAVWQLMSGGWTEWWVDIRSVESAGWDGDQGWNSF